MAISEDRLRSGFKKVYEKDCDFEDFWNKNGELLASMSKGNIKQFAKDIWTAAIKEYGELYLSARYKTNLKAERCSLCSRPFLHYLNRSVEK